VPIEDVSSDLKPDSSAQSSPSLDSPDDDYLSVYKPVSKDIRSILDSFQKQYNNAYPPINENTVLSDPLEDSDFINGDPALIWGSIKGFIDHAQDPATWISTWEQEEYEEQKRQLGNTPCVDDAIDEPLNKLNADHERYELYQGPDEIPDESCLTESGIFNHVDIDDPDSEDYYWYLSDQLEGRYCFEEEEAAALYLEQQEAIKDREADSNWEKEEYEEQKRQLSDLDREADSSWEEEEYEEQKRQLSNSNCEEEQCFGEAICQEDSSSQGLSFDDAKAVLKGLNRAARLVQLENKLWAIEYLPEREAELNLGKQKAEELKMQQQINAQKEEEARQERLIRGRKILQERARKKLEDEEREAALKKSLKSIRYQENSKKSVIDIDLTSLAEDLREQSISSSLASKFGDDADILMQYRHAGSHSEKGGEWGLWIIKKKNVYSAHHESPDRVRYGKRESDTVFGSRAEAISYANWLVSKDWYSDQRFIKSGLRNDDFPRRSPPSPQERLEALRRFRRWKDIGPRGSAS